MKQAAVVSLISLLRYLLAVARPTAAFIGRDVQQRPFHPVLSRTRERSSLQPRHVHDSVISPFTTQLPIDSIGSDSKELYTRNDEECRPEVTTKDQDDCSTIPQLIQLLKAKPTDLLRLESTSDGVRGVYLNRSIRKGDVVLSIPLSSCLKDSAPPVWLGYREHIEFASNYNPSEWATRLAASLIDLQLQEKRGANESQGHSLWLSLLPDPEFLRASLPVHWPEETVENASSTALELAVDSSFFGRAEAAEELLYSLKKQKDMVQGLSEDQLRELCNNALDLVQTRSCRVLEDDGTSPVRVLAPIFDFLNHGSIQSSSGAGANSEFQLEQDNVVVRAIRDINSNDEVLIDYGESARPAWKCLLSYGFVPRYNKIPGPGEGASEDSEVDDNVAEVYMDGVRYEVGPSTIPFDMVAAAATCLHPMTEEQETELSLTPELALVLARRISDVAYYLLLEPEGGLNDDHPSGTPTPSQVISNREAASLRWAQHRVLLACALGLREFAADDTISA